MADPNQIRAQTQVEALARIGGDVVKLTQNQITLTTDQSPLHSKLDDHQSCFQHRNLLYVIYF